jgi:hypothetical protein
MLQLKNGSPLVVGLAVLPDPDGIDTAYATIKGTFRIQSGEVSLAAEQQPLRFADEFWGDPATTSLRYAAEVHPSKPSTDVVLVGHAWAPKGKPVTRLDVQLRVGPIERSIRVSGDREWRPGFLFFPARATPAQPFKKMPLTFERAFGGTFTHPKRPEQVRFDERNPVGRGFSGGARGRALRGLALPNLEDPARPVRDPRQRPRPMSPGYVAPAWEPRKSCAGTYDHKWQRTRAPYLPTDFRPAYFNTAPPDMVCKGFLKGGERVQLENVSPQGPVRFQLPSASLDVRVRLAGADHRPPVNLETVLIEPDDARLTLIWRAALRCDKQALRVEVVEVTLGGLDGARS